LQADNPIGCYSTDAANYDGYRCNLTTYEKNGKRHVLNKDAKTKLDEMTRDFDLMLAEVDNVKAEYQDLSGKVKERGSDMDEMANLLAALDSAYDKANACVGMPTDQGSLWKFHAGRVIGYTLGTTAGIALGLIGVEMTLWSIGVGSLGLAAAGGVVALLPVIGVIGFAIAAFFGASKKRKAEKKRRQQIAKIAAGCKEGIRDYNKRLGQLADLFLCNQQNPIYKDDAGGL